MSAVIMYTAKLKHDHAECAEQCRESRGSAFLAIAVTDMPRKRNSMGTRRTIWCLEVHVGDSV